MSGELAGACGSRCCLLNPASGKFTSRGAAAESCSQWDVADLQTGTEPPASPKVVKKEVIRTGLSSEQQSRRGFLSK